MPDSSALCCRRCALQGAPWPLPFAGSPPPVISSAGLATSLAPLMSIELGGSSGHFPPVPYTLPIPQLPAFPQPAVSAPLDSSALVVSRDCRPDLLWPGLLPVAMRLGLLNPKCAATRQPRMHRSANLASLSVQQLERPSKRAPAPPPGCIPQVGLNAPLLVQAVSEEVALGRMDAGAAAALLSRMLPPETLQDQVWTGAEAGVDLGRI